MTEEQADAAGPAAQTVETANCSSTRSRERGCRGQSGTALPQTAQPTGSPSPASARTGPRGWNRSAEASKPCSLECRHWPAFSSCRLWAGRAWAGAGWEETGISSRSHPGAQVTLPGPRGPLPGRALGLRSGSPSAGSPAGFPRNAHKLKPTVHIESTPYSAKISSFYQNLFLNFN